MDGFVEHIYLSNSYLVAALEAKSVVDRNHSVSVGCHLAEPAVVVLVVPCSSDESSAEHEQDGRLLLALEGGLAAFLRVIYVHEEVACVSLDKHVCAVRLDGLGGSVARIQKRSTYGQRKKDDCFFHIQSFLSSVISFSDGMSLLMALNRLKKRNAMTLTTV